VSDPFASALRDCRAPVAIVAAVGDGTLLPSRSTSREPRPWPFGHCRRGAPEGKPSLRLLRAYGPQMKLSIVTVGEHWSGLFLTMEPVQSGVAVVTALPGSRIQIPPPRLTVGSL
jgi:hypothetical protein